MKLHYNLTFSVGNLETMKEQLRSKYRNRINQAYNELRYFKLRL
jgi:hypothetical protein